MKIYQSLLPNSFHKQYLFAIIKQEKMLGIKVNMTLLLSGAGTQKDNNIIKKILENFRTLKCSTSTSGITYLIPPFLSFSLSLVSHRKQSYFYLPPWIGLETLPLGDPWCLMKHKVSELPRIAMSCSWHTTPNHHVPLYILQLGSHSKCCPTPNSWVSYLYQPAFC